MKDELPVPNQQHDIKNVCDEHIKEEEGIGKTEQVGIAVTI
jgi:hypothetical protein